MSQRDRNRQSLWNSRFPCCGTMKNLPSLANSGFPFRGGAENRLPGLPPELGVSMPRCDGSRPSAGKAGFPRPAVTTAAQVRTKSRVSMSHRAGNLCHVRGGVSGIRVGSARESRETEPVVRALEFGYMRLGRAFGYMRSLGTAFAYARR